METHEDSVEGASGIRSAVNRRPKSLLLVAMTLVWGSAAASAQPTCTLSQITETTGGFGSGQTSISADGNRIAFPSDRDLTGENPDGNVELFLYDISSSTVLQVTQSTTGSNDAPSINADGTRVAFQSTSDLTGGNADGNDEIFLFDVLTGRLRQVTVSGGASNIAPSINADGTRVAFYSDGNLTGENPDGSGEVFFVDAVTSDLIQITHGSMDDISFSPSISADGKWIALESSLDLTGENPDHNEEIFLYDLAARTTTQISRTTDVPNFLPSVSADGTRVAFSSTADLTGGNPDANFEIYLFDSTNGTFSQITDTTGDTAPVAQISANGRHIAILSEADLTGGNPDGNVEIFLYDTETGTFRQLTNTTGNAGTGVPSINDDGTRVSFPSAADLTGANGDGNSEVLLLECSDMVVIAGCDSGVPNVLLAGGGTIMDKILECAAGAKNHGNFASCVSHLTNALKASGIITGAQKGAIQRCAGK